MTGIYLQGGGAKGAFQAGVVYALHELGVTFDVVTGTSIGAINGYYIYKGQYEALKDMWLDVDESGLSYVKEDDNVIENVFLINQLKDLKSVGHELKAFYVNYVNVIDCRLVESYDDLVKFNKEEGLKRIRFSALLPKPTGLKLDRESLETFDSKYLFDSFKEELIHGEYNDMSLDGGILNNHFLEPFTHEKVDRIILVPFQPNYAIPAYVLDHYDESQLIIIDPIESFLPMDTLRFETDFCNKQFKAGYNRAVEMWNTHF